MGQVASLTGFSQQNYPDWSARGDELPLEAGLAARQLFNTKRANCAEAVFKAVHQLVGGPLPPMVSALLTPMGSGVAITGDICGAMVAGVMAMGLVYGRNEPEAGTLEQHRGDLWKTYALYNQLPHRFREKFGTTNCWELTEPRVYGTKECRCCCEVYVQESAAMAMELLLEAKREGMDFTFNKSLLDQNSKRTGLTAEELIEYKRAGKHFPRPENNK